MSDRDGLLETGSETCHQLTFSPLPPAFKETIICYFFIQFTEHGRQERHLDLQAIIATPIIFTEQIIMIYIKGICSHRWEWSQKYLSLSTLSSRDVFLCFYGRGPLLFIRQVYLNGSMSKEG